MPTRSKRKAPVVKGRPFLALAERRHQFLCPDTQHPVADDYRHCAKCEAPACARCVVRFGDYDLCKIHAVCLVCPRVGKTVSRCAGCGRGVCPSHRYHHDGGILRPGMTREQAGKSAYCRQCAPAAAHWGSGGKRGLLGKFWTMPIYPAQVCPACGKSGQQCRTFGVTGLEQHRALCCTQCHEGNGHTLGLVDWDSGEPAPPLDSDAGQRMLRAVAAMMQGRAYNAEIARVIRMHRLEFEEGA